MLYVKPKYNPEKLRIILIISTQAIFGLLFGVFAYDVDENCAEANITAVLKTFMWICIGIGSVEIMFNVCSNSFRDIVTLIPYLIIQLGCLVFQFIYGWVIFSESQSEPGCKMSYYLLLSYQVVETGIVAFLTAYGIYLIVERCRTKPSNTFVPSRGQYRNPNRPE
jgi:hypothetical protein